MLRNLSEKLVEEFVPTILGSSMANISCLDGALSEIPELQVSPVKSQQLQQKDKKRRKRKREEKMNLQTLPFAHARAKMS